MKKPWKDMDFTEEELRELERSGRVPRSPEAHQPEVAPRGWLAPPPSELGDEKPKRLLMDELDQVVDSAFSSVQGRPPSLVQWLDANVLVTDHGASDTEAVSDPVGAAEVPKASSPPVPPQAVPPPAPPGNGGSAQEIHVEVDLDEGAEGLVDDEVSAAAAGGAEEEAGKPTAVDAVFRALAGDSSGAAGAGTTDEAVAQDSETAVASAEPVADSESAPVPEPASGQVESGTYELEDTISDGGGLAEEVTELAEEAGELDEGAPTLLDAGPAQGRGPAKTVKMSVHPMGAGAETVQMMPPPPPPPGASDASDGLPGQPGPMNAAALASGDPAALQEEGLVEELEVELDSLTGTETSAEASVEESDLSSSPERDTVDNAVSEPAGQVEVDEEAASSSPAAVPQPQVPPSPPGSPVPASAPPPVPAEKRGSPPPVPAGKKTATLPRVPVGQQPPPPPPGAGQTGASAPPPVPKQEKADKGAVTVPQGPEGERAAQAKSVEAKPPKPPEPVRKKPWYQDFFDDDYLPTLPHETPESTLKEVEFFLSELSLPEEGRVLDVGCGYGRHAVEFAARGFSVVGLDNSLPMLIKAAEFSQFRGVEVDFVQDDMREMGFKEEFDGLYCFGTTFGYFGDDENRDILRRMNQALKPGGRLLLEVVNRDFLLADLPLRVWWEGDACLVMDEVDFNYFTSRVEAHRTVVFNDGRQIERNMSIRVYSLHELGIQLFQSGFRVLKITGHLATRGRFFGMHSPHLIVTALKKK